MHIHRFRTPGNGPHEVTDTLHAAVARSGLRLGSADRHHSANHRGADGAVLSRSARLEDVADELARLVPTRIDFKHQHDTPQDAAGHIKSALVGVSLSLIVADGALQLGHSQGVYFMEFDGPRDRQLYLQLLPAADVPEREKNDG